MRPKQHLPVRLEPHILDRLKRLSMATGTSLEETIDLALEALEREQNLPETVTERMAFLEKYVSDLVEAVKGFGAKMDELFTEAGAKEKERLRSLYLLLEDKLATHDVAEKERIAALASHGYLTQICPQSASEVDGKEREGKDGKASGGAKDDRRDRLEPQLKPGLLLGMAVAVLLPGLITVGMVRCSLREADNEAKRYEAYGRSVAARIARAPLEDRESIQAWLDGAPFSRAGKVAAAKRKGH